MSDADARARRTARILVAACLLALLGIGMSLLHFIWPTPLTFTLFMLAGQGGFAVAMGLYALVVLSDLRARNVL